MPRQRIPNSQKSPTAKLAPELLPGTPAKPANLSPQASAEWDRLSRELAEAGIQVSVAHRASLTLAATIAADLAEGWEAVKRDGAYVQGKSGLQAHPATKRIDALRRDYIKVLASLGLRAAVSGETPDAEDDLEAILAG